MVSSIAGALDARRSPTGRLHNPARFCMYLVEEKELGTARRSMPKRDTAGWHETRDAPSNTTVGPKSDMSFRARWLSSLLRRTLTTERVASHVDMARFSAAKADTYRGIRVTTTTIMMMMMIVIVMALT